MLAQHKLLIGVITRLDYSMFSPVRLLDIGDYWAFSISCFSGTTEEIFTFFNYFGDNFSKNLIFHKKKAILQIKNKKYCN